MQVPVPMGVTPHPKFYAGWSATSSSQLVNCLTTEITYLSLKTKYFVTKYIYQAITHMFKKIQKIPLFQDPDRTKARKVRKALAKKRQEAHRRRKLKQEAKEKAKFLDKDSPKVKYASEMHQ